MTIWSPFAQDTDYMEPNSASFMINFRVADLDTLLATLRAEGCNVIDKTEMSEQGKFGWVIDPEGNKIELWQPPLGQSPFRASDKARHHEISAHLGWHQKHQHP